MRKQKQHKLKLLQRTNRTAPASANGEGDRVLPPLKGPSSCSWARPSTVSSLPSKGALLMFFQVIVS